MSRWRPGRRDLRVTTNPRLGVPLRRRRPAARLRRWLPRIAFDRFARRRRG